jgi:hypothetical protein
MSLSPDRVCHTARGSLLLFACALLMALPASAQVYKWVDSKGVTHYDGSPPPPSASSSQTLAIPVAPAATETSSESWQEKDNAFKSRYDKRKADEAKQDEIDKKAQAAKETACLRAQQRLDFLQTYGRIYHVDASGNRVFETDAQREQDFTNVNAAIAQNCHG